MHAMRSRIIKSPAFSGERIIGAILFERTMDGDIDGKPTASFLWGEQGRRAVPQERQGHRERRRRRALMKPMPELNALPRPCGGQGIFGTRCARSSMPASASGIAAIVAQQFEVGHQILAKGLMPIIEPR